MSSFISEVVAMVCCRSMFLDGSLSPMRPRDGALIPQPVPCLARFEKLRWHSPLQDLRALELGFRVCTREQRNTYLVHKSFTNRRVD